MKKPEIQGNHILLLGYGREGKSTHRYLLTHYPKISIGIADKSLIKPIAPVTNLHLGVNYLNSLSNYDTVVRSPGIPVHTPELEEYRRSKGHITTATNVFFSGCPGTTIGVTGTKGKSTTSALIAAILELNFPDVRLVGNIGAPALDHLEGATQDTVFVIELSSHQLEDIRYSPQVAVILKVVAEHLDYYANFEAYQLAKSNIVAFQKPTDVVIFNPGHAASARMARRGRAKKYQFSLKPDPGSLSWIEKNQVFATINNQPTPIIPVSLVPLKGNRENILAAVAVGALFKVSASRIRQALKTFKSLPHRLEYVGEFKGIKFYNDSLSTIPQATIHALVALGPAVETLIAGGFERGLDYAGLGEYLAQLKNLKTLILFPDTGAKIWKAIPTTQEKPVKPGLQKLRHFFVTSMEEAVAIAFRETSSGKICLLSPASASFNLFRDYAERGERFKELVKKL